MDLDERLAAWAVAWTICSSVNNDMGRGFGEYHFNDLGANDVFD
jgi:hypothetical protein